MAFCETGILDLSPIACENIKFNKKGTFHEKNLRCLEGITGAGGVSGTGAGTAEVVDGEFDIYPGLT
jgi:hypothetical protein